jgi:shikimate dehydrogenase
MRPTASSKLLAVIGDPVAHSLSPVMQNAAIATMGLDAVYVAIRADDGALPHIARAFEAIGLAGNVTVPHKVAMARLLIRLTGLAKELGAVNTFWSEGGRLIGDNTDVRGVMDAVAEIDGEGPWLVIGTGGSARAVAAAARELGEALVIRSRTRDRAESFASWAQDLGVDDACSDDGRPVSTVINTTPLGLSGADRFPLPESRLEGANAALDLVYAAGETSWIRACRERGLRAADGRSVLVAQGARAFERFFPGVTAPREAMAAAVHRALEP